MLFKTNKFYKMSFWSKSPPRAVENNDDKDMSAEEKKPVPQITALMPDEVKSLKPNVDDEMDKIK